MRHRLVWTALGIAITALLIFTSCQQTPSQSGQTQATQITGKTSPSGTTSSPAAPATTTAPGKTTAAPTAASNLVKDSLGRMVAKPQYGGTATFMSSAWGYFDPTWQVNSWPANLLYEPMIFEPYAKGPSGTNELPLDSTYTPYDKLVGSLAESWDVPNSKSVVFHLRQGVRFPNKPPMNGREMTADDIVADWGIYQKVSRSPYYISATTDPARVTKITKIDKYTVRFDMYLGSQNPWTVISQTFCPFAPEVFNAAGDLMDWKNASGTGPYIVSDAVVDSSITYRRNDVYWQKDPFFPDNQLPYPDKVLGLIIPDSSTRLAALRTHKIDLLGGLAWDVAEDMKKTNPEIKYRKFLSTTSPLIQMRTDLAPFSDIRVRQALHMGFNRQNIIDNYYKGNAEILTWPEMPNCIGVYTPLNQLPQDIQDLYKFNQAGAKKLLADAGFPNGFKANVTIIADYADLLSIVREDWTKIGVTIDFTIVDYATLTTTMVNKNYKDMSMVYWGNIGPWSAPGWAYRANNPLYNYSVVNEPDFFDKKYDDAANAATLQDAYTILKEINIYALRKTYYIQLPTLYLYNFWQPWIKQYSGEYLVGRYYNTLCAFFYCWIDQGVKTQITGQK